MGYIRDNVDAFIDEGYDPEEAEVQARLLEEDIDYGFCNPIKAKLAHEEEQKIRDEVKQERESKWK